VISERADARGDGRRPRPVRARPGGLRALFP